MLHVDSVIIAIMVKNFVVRNIIYTVAIGPVNRTAIPVALVRYVTLVAKVTASVISTTVRLTVERSIDLDTVGRTMMEASVAWPDSFRRDLVTRD